MLKMFQLHWLDVDTSENARDLEASKPHCCVQKIGHEY